MNTPARSTMLRLPAVTKMTGLPRSTVYDLIAAGSFPRQVKLSERCSAWVEAEVQEWLAAKIAART